MPSLAAPAGGVESQTMAQMETPRCTLPAGATCLPQAPLTLHAGVPRRGEAWNQKWDIGRRPYQGAVEGLGCERYDVVISFGRRAIASDEICHAARPIICWQVIQNNLHRFCAVLLRQQQYVPGYIVLESTQGSLNRHSAGHAPPLAHPPS